MIERLKTIATGVLVIIALTQCNKQSTTTQETTFGLVSTFWRLAEFNGLPLKENADSSAVHIAFSIENNEKHLSGYAGCNTIGGSYTDDGEAIKLNPISTRMMCPEAMDIENFLLYALNNADRYTITGNILELYKGEMMLAKFEGQSPP